MKYVLDSSVALKCVLPEPDSQQAIELRDAFQNAVHELLAPDVFPIEAAHALAKAERMRTILVGQGSLFLAELLGTSVPLRDSLTLLPRPFEIASQMRVSLYDCLYVALAENEQCELLTADKRLINSLAKHFPQVVHFSSIA